MPYIETTKEHQKIWLEIAHAFFTPSFERTEKQKEITSLGLCRAFCICTDKVYFLSHYNIEIADYLQLFSNTMDRYSYWFPTRMSTISESPFCLPLHQEKKQKKYDDLRGMYALLFSQMTLNEFLELSNKVKKLEK